MTHAPITGSGSAFQEPNKARQPTASEAYLGVARGMMPGISMLVGGTADCASALALVSAHTLECILKAYLSRCINEDDAVIKTHDLRKLWDKATIDILMGWTTTPEWMLSISGLHSAPYPLRYLDSRAGFLNGLVFPVMSTMVEDIRAIFERVEQKWLEHGSAPQR